MNNMSMRDLLPVHTELGRLNGSNTILIRNNYLHSDVACVNKRFFRVHA